jgi:hypothetical protein
MHGRFFVDHTYTEIFVVVLDLGRHQRIEIYNELSDVIKSLNCRSVNNSRDIKVIHGHLLPATILPDDFNRLSAFIFVNLPNTNYGLFIEDIFYSPDVLAAAIQTAINHKYNKIEDIFILYGTKIALTLSIAVDELDEELIERSCVIAKKVKQAEMKLETNR